MHLDETPEGRPLRVDVQISRPRPTARVLRSPREEETATDFDVRVDVSSRSRGVERSCEGEITVWRRGQGWQPCRSTLHGPDAGWLHGGALPRLLEDLRREARPIGVDVSRRLLEVLSGAGWPQGSPFAGDLRRCETYHTAALELRRDAIIPGDIVRHANSGKEGIVIRTGQIHPDDTAEYLIQASDADGRDPEPIWWNSRWARRVAWRDPYRRYLAMVAAEGDSQGRIWRASGRRSRHGGSLTREAWDQMYWRLCNLRRDAIHADRGRERWTTAALDCLDRRDHAQRTSWLDAEGRATEAMSRSPFRTLSSNTRADP